MVGSRAYAGDGGREEGGKRGEVRKTVKMEEECARTNVHCTIYMYMLCAKFGFGLSEDFSA